MVSRAAIAFIVVMQLCSCCPLFVDNANFEADMSDATYLGRLVMAVALLDLLYNWALLPDRYTNVPQVSRLILEAIAAILAYEFVMNVVWHRLEMITGELVKSVYPLLGIDTDTYEEWQDFILGSITLLSSLFVLAHVLTATNQVQVIPKEWIGGDSGAQAARLQQT